LLPDQPLPALRRLAVAPSGSRLEALDALCIVVAPGSAASALRGFGPAAQVAVERVEAIPPQPSGKHRLAWSEVPFDAGALFARP